MIKRYLCNTKNKKHYWQQYHFPDIKKMMHQCTYCDNDQSYAFAIVIINLV